MTDVFSDASDSKTEIDQTKNYYEELVGENKKFKSNEDLARGKAESDNYISHLTNQLDVLKEELTKRKTVEEIADQLRDRAKTTAQSNQEPTGDDEDEPKGQNSLKLEDIERLLEKKIKEQESFSQASRNLNEVNTKLSEKFGDSASRVIREKANSLGVTVEYLESQAKANPKVFYRLIELDKSSNTSSFAPPQTQRNASIEAGFEGERTEKYYQKLLKENPNLYFDAKTSIQMHKDAQRLGARFFDT